MVKWEDLIKKGENLYHPITAINDGFFYKVVFEDDYEDSMGDDLTMHLKYRNWEETSLFSTKLYEVHLGMKPDLQGKGNAEKMIVGAVLDKNEVLEPIPLYINYIRVLNSRVMSVVEKLKSNPLLETKELMRDGEPVGLLMSKNFIVLGE